MYRLTRQASLGALPRPRGAEGDGGGGGRLRSGHTLEPFRAQEYRFSVRREKGCVIQHRITPGIHPVYALYTPLIAAYAPMYTRYTCLYTIHTVHLTHL